MGHGSEPSICRRIFVLIATRKFATIAIWSIMNTSETRITIQDGGMSRNGRGEGNDTRGMAEITKDIMNTDEPFAPFAPFRGNPSEERPFHASNRQQIGGHQDRQDQKKNGGTTMPALTAGGGEW
jgi:hypothetical protein